MDLQVVVNHYGDADMIETTLSTVTDELPGVPVVVADGRYANFERLTGGDLTPRTPEICSRYEQVEYVQPPDHYLPFGEEKPHGRYPYMRKAEWLWYEVADPDVWALKVDADERLLSVDLDLDDLDRGKKYLAGLDMPGQRKPVENPRLWVPERWTFFTDDLCYPRDEVGRDTTYEDLRDMCGPGLTWVRYGNLSEEIRIENRGHERSEDYVDSRNRVKNEVADEGG